jgi:hypothetical protein
MKLKRENSMKKKTSKTVKWLKANPIATLPEATKLRLAVGVVAFVYGVTFGALVF